MTTKIFRGFLIATTASMLAVAAQAADAPKQTITPDVGKFVAAAQKAEQAKDTKGALAALAQAKAVAGRTPYDDYVIARVTVNVDLDAQDFAGAAAAMEAAVDSPAQPDADRAANLKNAVILTVNNKEYDKAAGYAKALMATNPTDPRTVTVMAQAFVEAKDNADAVTIAQKNVDASVAAGQKPDHDVMEFLMTAQSGVKDEAGAEKTLELLVASYNDPADWTQMIDIALGTQAPRDVDAVWLGRLAPFAGVTMSALDASIIGQAANHLTFYGDASTALSNGGTGFTNPTANADKDKKSIAAQIAAGQKQGGQYNATLADTLYGYGMYPEAETAARLAISKGGAKDTSEAPMVLGQALVAQGKYDDAIAAFGQVTGGGPATARVARLWIDVTKGKKAPAAGAAPAATAK